MPNGNRSLAILPSTQDQRCNLSAYGIGKDVIDVLFHVVVQWLQGRELEWPVSKEINHFQGPEGRSVIELLFMQNEAENSEAVATDFGVNNCKLYLYDDHLSLNFMCEGPDPSAQCGLNFKYSSKWYETDTNMIVFLMEYLTNYLKRLFDVEPRRFDGTDEEVQTMTELVNSLKRTIAGDGMMG